MQHIELLAPAGSFEALKAAVQNGADAIYLGGADFGARAYASNFDRDTMKEAVEYAHIRGVKIYVTVNTLIKDNEIKSLTEYVKFLYEIDVDAVIVQDIGAFNLIKELFPDFEIHASTQMTLHNKYGVELLKNMGVHRAVLARELTIKEIKNIYDELDIELEVFVHGALCVSYSGQCLMSSFIGGRSGNRGRCAQPCRREYSLLNLKADQMLDKDKAFHLSMRDLNTLEEVGKLIDAGVTSFKIEGRMKKPQYVASIVKNYRRAIDTYLENKIPLKDRALQEEMEQMFNRKFTKGYLFSSPKIEVINIEKSNNRGLYLGKVDNFDIRESRLRIRLEVDIAQGDGIEIVNKSSEDIGGTVRNIYINNKLVKNAKSGEVVEIEMRGKIQKGDEVYKTLNVSLMDELERTYAYDKEYKKISLYGDIAIKIKDKIKLNMWDEDGYAVSAESKDTVQAAINVPLTKEKLLDQLSKLGNTPFSLDHLDIRLEENSSIPISVLNSLRREAIGKLENLRKTRHNREKVNNESLTEKLESLTDSDGNDYEQVFKDKKISVKVDTLEQLRVVLNHPIHRVYYGDISNFKEAISLCKNKNIEIYLRTPAILRNMEYEKLGNLLKGLSFQGILAGDLGIIRFNNEHFNLPIIGDFSLNIMNSYTIDSFEKLGFKGITLSPELDFKTIYRLNLSNALEKEAIIYGKTTVMTTEYCPLIQENKCDHKCEECRYPKYTFNFGLKDQKNIIFPLGKDYWGRSIILNSNPLFMLDRLHDFKGVNIEWLRLEFTDETDAEIEHLLLMTLKNISSAITGVKSRDTGDYDHMLRSGFTRGHYYRGVE